MIGRRVSSAFMSLWPVGQPGCCPYVKSALAIRPANIFASVNFRKVSRFTVYILV